MEVTACGYGGREEIADGVYSLEDAFHVAAAGDLFDEDGGEAF